MISLVLKYSYWDSGDFCLYDFSCFETSDDVTSNEIDSITGGFDSTAQQFKYESIVSFFCPDGQSVVDLTSDVAYEYQDYHCNWNGSWILGDGAQLGTCISEPNNIIAESLHSFGSLFIIFPSSFHGFGIMAF